MIFHCKIVVFYIVFFSGLDLSAQHDFVVSNNSPMTFFVGVPNPVIYASFEFHEDSIRLSASNGEVFFRSESTYWIPYSWNSKLMIEVRQGSSWMTVDTIRAKLAILNTQKLTIKISPVSRHGAFPILNSFDSIWVSSELSNYAYLGLDSLFNLVSYEVDVLGFEGEKIDSLIFNSQESLYTRKEFKSKIRLLEDYNKVVFKNFKVRFNLQNEIRGDLEVVLKEEIEIIK